MYMYGDISKVYQTYIYRYYINKDVHRIKMKTTTYRPNLSLHKWLLQASSEISDNS